MVVGAFPGLKLFVLATKQVSKPIAQVIISKAKSTPFFRNYICMPPAQFYNWVEVKLKMWLLNMGWNVAVPRLSEPAAIELGANMLSELIIFGIGAGLIFLELSRQSSNDRKKTKQSHKRQIEFEETLAQIMRQTARQEEEIRALEKALAYINGSIFDEEILV